MGAALGFSQESGLPFEWGLIRNHYVGRTFIEPRQGQRSAGVKIKLNPVRQRARGPARGADRRLDRARHHLAQDREDGARGRARARCTCASRARPPPVPATTASTRRSSSELIAATHEVEEIRRFVDADSLGYLSHEGLLKAAGDAPGRRHCTACFSGRYPVAVTLLDESQLRLFEKARA